MANNSKKQKMTKKDLLAISQGLAYINSKETKVWHTLSKNLDMISPLVNAVNAEHRVITDELAPKDDKGTPVRNQQNQIDFGDNLEEANKRWDNIMSEEIEIEIITIPLDDLKDYGLDANMMKPLLGKLVLEK
tara:strand:+ start:17210 stop:17608 length:399 start_codon:yes stop_codon:yes gene_type:complete